MDLHAYAACPHDLADHIGHGEAVEQGAPVLVKRQPVLRQEMAGFTLGDNG
jgi:hypothetical protein